MDQILNANVLFYELAIRMAIPELLPFRRQMYISLWVAETLLQEHSHIGFLHNILFWVILAASLNLANSR